MSKIKIKPLIFIIAALALLVIFNWLIFGKKTVEFNWLDIDDQTVSSLQTKNKLTLINYWATWCPPCIKEMPALNHFQKKYPNQVQILGVNYEQSSKDKIKQFIIDRAINYPIIIYQTNDLTMFNQITGLPTTIVLYNNRYIKIHTGELLAADLENFYQEYRNEYPRKN